MRAEVERAVEAIRRGEPRATERALGLLQDTVFSFSMKVCGRREDAEDTAQETLLQALSKLSDFSSPKALAVWLYKVAKSRCLMSRRKGKTAPKEQLSLDALMPDRAELERMAATVATPERAAIHRESEEHIQKAVRSLPPAFRLVLVLHDMEGLTPREIGRVLEIREGTVRVRLHRARLFVRKALAASEGAPRPTSRSAAQGRPAARDGRCRRLFAELSEYLEERLPDATCEEIESHLDDCPPCRVFLDSLKETVERCRGHQAAAEIDPRKAAACRAALRARLAATNNRSPAVRAALPRA